MPCVIMFAVRFLSDARQSPSLPCVFLKVHDKYLRTVSTLFAVRFPIDARQIFVFAVRSPSDAQQSLFTNGRTYRSLWPFTDVNLCRALKENARQRQKICRVFVLGARQTMPLPCLFLLAHDKGFSKKWPFTNGRTYRPLFQ
jgi:hypothetical protein